MCPNSGPASAWISPVAALKQFSNIGAKPIMMEDQTTENEGKR